MISIDTNIEVLNKVLFSIVGKEIIESPKIKQENNKIEFENKKAKKLYLSQHKLLEQIAINKNMSQSLVVDSLIIEKYLKEGDKNIIYKIHERIQIIEEIFKSEIGSEKYNSIKKEFLSQKYKNKKSI